MKKIFLLAMLTVLGTTFSNAQETSKKAKKAKTSAMPIGKKANVPKGKAENNIPELENIMARIKNNFLMILNLTTRSRR